MDSGYATYWCKDSTTRSLEDHRMLLCKPTNRVLHCAVDEQVLECRINSSVGFMETAYIVMRIPCNKDILLAYTYSIISPVNVTNVGTINISCI